MRNGSLFKSLVLLTFFLQGLQASLCKPPETELEQNFATPPVVYAPSCFWWWFGCPYTARDIHENLDSMKDAGLGGFRIYPVYSFPAATSPAGIENASYLSPRFLEMVRETVKYGRQLGLVAESQLGTGWPFGGPYIPPKMGAGQLKFFALDIEGPREFSGEIPGKAKAPEEILAVQLAQVNAEGGLDLVTVRDLTAQVHEGKLVKWQVPPGRWKLMTFIGGYIGMSVKRASPGGEGLVLDHFNREALDLHLKHNGDVQAPSLQGAWAITMDSWEVFGSNWTSDLPREFQRRRGYSLLPYLAAIFFPTGETGKHVRYDFRLTLSELALDNFFRPLKDWAYGRGFKTRIEAHGTPADILEAYGINDIPEGETYGPEDRRHINIRDRKFASSAAHLYGRNEVSCESFTWLRYPLFLVTLENMKAAADAIYLDGINHVNYHGVPFSPSWVESPGWYYYAATNASPGNTWWPYLKYLSGYLRRANYMLQQGAPVIDVAVYLPYEDVWSDAFGDWFDLAGALEAHLSGKGVSSSSAILEALQNGGFSFDFINASRIKEARIDGPLLCAGPMRYRVVVLPALKTIEPEALHRLRDFCRSGGTVVGTDRLPDVSPGFQNIETETGRVRRLVREIFGGIQDPTAAPWRGESRARGNLCGRGEGVYIPPDPAQSLVPQAHLLPRLISRVVTPDLQIDPPDNNVGFVHRDAGSQHIYFIANVSDREKSLRVTFRIAGLHPRLFDPETGAVRPLYLYQSLGSLTEAQLNLKPWGSLFVVFSGNPVVSAHSSNLDHISTINDDGRSAEGEVSGNGSFFLRTSQGLLRASVSDLPAPLALTGPWLLAKEGKPAGTLENLVSWTQFEGFEDFSGTASYRTQFSLAEIYVNQTAQFSLDLGDVRDIADVLVNGEPAGVLWKQPFVVDVRHWVRAGQNELEIRVTNRLINRMRLAASLPLPYPDLKDRVTQPVASGLLGPVWLRPARRLVLTP